MQAELDAEAPGAVQLLGVNDDGFEDASDLMAELGDIPLLQDTEAVDAWSRWGATYRDVVVVDAEGRFVAAYNLTRNDLGDPARFEELKGLLREAR